MRFSLLGVKSVWECIMVTHSPPVVARSGLALKKSLAAPQPGACSFTFSTPSGIAPDTPVDDTCRHFNSHV